MFCLRARPNFKFPKLKGRASEIRSLAAPLLLTWTEFMDPASLQHKQIRLLLQCSLRMEEILSETKHLNRITGAAHTELVQQCDHFLLCSTAVARHFNAEGIKVFNIVPKHHLLWHCCNQAQFLHPRLSWCYSGEDFMQHMRRLAQSVLRGTPANMISRKVAFKFVRGFTWRLTSRKGDSGASSSA